MPDPNRHLPLQHKPESESFTADLSAGSHHMVTVDGRNLAAVMLGRRGGLKGGKARAAALSPERRREIAKAAAMVRWGNGDSTARK